jgi:hypothetical protein
MTLFTIIRTIWLGGVSPRMNIEPLIAEEVAQWASYKKCKVLPESDRSGTNELCALVASEFIDFLA